MTKTSDPALDALKAVYEQADFRFEYPLLVSCYRIEKDHQFTEERDIPLAELRQRVNTYVDTHELEGKADDEL